MTFRSETAMDPDRIPPPPPMPQIRGALLMMQDANSALKRGLSAWNASQLRDAIASAQRFLDLAEKRLDAQGEPVEEQPRQSTNGRKKRIRRWKVENNYERHCATCRGCVHVDRETPGIPRERPYVPWWCTAGQFLTVPTAVCDQWRGKNGDTWDEAS